MKHFLRHFSSHPGFSLFFSFLFLFFFLLAGTVFLLPARFHETFLGEMKYKLRLLEETPGKRIILIGGSSAAFSMKSELVKEELSEYSPVNFGMYADLGFVPMLDWAKAEIHEGDIILLSPEQDAQTLSCRFSGEDVWEAADGEPELLRLLSAKRLETLAAALPSFAGKKLFYTVAGAPNASGLYSRASFNQYGDIESAERGANILPNGYDSNQPISFSSDLITEEFTDELNAFAEYAEKKGASVYYRFPPINESALADGTTKATINEYYDELCEALDFPILGDPFRSIMESGWFYDTNFHLNDSGAVVFTKYLIEDIKVLLLDTSVTSIRLPSMPAALSKSESTDLLSVTDSRDSSFADCFSYQETANGLIISGLNEKGSSLSSLIIPWEQEGKKVTGIAADAFQNCSSLKELTVQENISLLPDELFQGCTSFRKLILTSSSPSSYFVGDHLTDGADFFICVPKESLETYRRDYSWQKYSSVLAENS